MLRNKNNGDSLGKSLYTGLSRSNIQYFENIKVIHNQKGTKIINNQCKIRVRNSKSIPIQDKEKITN